MNETANIRIGGYNNTEAVPTITPPADHPFRQPDPDPVYDFEHLGLRIAESLVVAAETQVAEANALLDQTRMVADTIRSQVQILSGSLGNFNGRLKTFGSELLEAHRKFNGNA